MFKGKVHLYRNVDGKETELKREFDDKKDFDAFVENNPELKELRDWKPVRWPSLANLGRLFDEFEKLGKRDFLEDIEKEMSELFEKSKKLLK